MEEKNVLELNNTYSKIKVMFMHNLNKTDEITKNTKM
jgi:hypothetical protein